MKRIFVLLLLSLIFIPGCSIKYIDDKDVDKIIDSFLSKKLNLYNQVSSGYKYYLPRGVRVIDNTAYNEKLYAGGNTYFLYVDVVSYHFNKDFTYVENKDAYYSKKLDYNGKKGYIEINVHKGLYFIEMMFNYAKVETFVLKKDIENTIINISYVLSSIKFNDKIINKLFDEDLLNYNEEQFELFEPKRDTGDFLDYVKKFDQYEDTIDDEDLIAPTQPEIKTEGEIIINDEIFD